MSMILELRQIEASAIDSLLSDPDQIEELLDLDGAIYDSCVPQENIALSCSPAPNALDSLSPGPEIEKCLPKLWEGQGLGVTRLFPPKMRWQTAFQSKEAKFPDFMAISSRCSLING